MAKSDGRRVARVEREVQAAIAQYLIRGFKSPLPGIVTVAKVMMPADLRSAKVYVSAIGLSEEEITRKKQMSETLELLTERSFEIQKYLGSELKMRYCPKLSFFEDDTTEQVMKVDRLLREIGSPNDVSTDED
ncbi:MAG: 30S ribosome-binding factor RbfA [Proteobacteria bacterium]|jgi:ribosome-binding factor A|nr:30S ribosome-binding factor RbfA [Pseudomonadota bacterium]